MVAETGELREARTRVSFFVPVGNDKEEQAIRSIIDYLQQQRRNPIIPVTGFTRSQFPDAVFAGYWWSDPKIHLMSVLARKDLPDEGRHVIIVALVGTNLHIRIFDTSGKTVVDKAENELISGVTLMALKKRLDPFPDESRLSKEDKQEIIRNATSIARHAHQWDEERVISFIIDYGFTLDNRQLSSTLRRLRKVIARRYAHYGSVQEEIWIIAQRVVRC